MIESLTKEQELQLETYKDKWIKIGLECSPCDMEECVKYGKMAYEAAGLTFPDKVFHAKNPVEASEIAKREGCESSNPVSDMMYGSHDAGWLSFYDYIYEVLEVKEVEPLLGLIGLAKHCGWWAAYDDCVIFQDRHLELKLDDEGQLHNEDGPAVKYGGGFNVYAIGGVRLSEKVVMSPEELTIEEINSEVDMDVRSIMIERHGWHEFLAKINAKCVDEHENFVEGTLEALYETVDFGNRLVVTCPTGRVFTMGVPSDISSCESAQHWLGNDTDIKFNVIGRT
jgi:hypothetical protein